MAEFLTCTQQGRRLWTNVNAGDTKYLGCQNQRQELLFNSRDGNQVRSAELAPRMGPIISTYIDEPRVITIL